MTKTFLPDKVVGLSGLGQAIIAGRVLVFSIRPPTPQAKGWAVNFRQSDRETHWNYGPTKPTLEEAVMDALEKIERALENGNVSHLAFGRTHVPGPKRFATIEDRSKNTHRGEGDTVTEAVDSALGKLEKSWPKKTAKPPEILIEDDPLADLLG